MKKDKKAIYKYLSIFILALVSIGVIFLLINFESKREVLSEGQLEAKDSSNTDENKSDEDNNNSYIDDAKEVSDRTNSLAKKEVSYPVRNDGKKVVYLTFDDGPSPVTTPKILDILDQYKAKATFFITACNLEGSQEAADLLKREYENGHAIGNHTYSHNYNYLYPDKTSEGKRIISVNNFMEEVNKCNNKLKEILGSDFSTRAIRFPGGYWSWEGRTNIRPVLDENGYVNIYWNAMDGDAEGGNKTKSQLVEEAKKEIEECGPDADSIVILMHDIKEGTVEALPEIIEYCESKGFEFRTIK